MVRRAPRNVEYRVNLAQAHNNLGLNLVNLDKREEGRTHYRAAIQAYEFIVKEHGEVPEYKVSLAKSCFNLGNLLRIQNEANNALDWHNKAIGLLKPLHESARQVVEYRMNLMRAYDSRAKAYDVLQRYPEAIADWDQAIRLADDFTGPVLRSYRALTMARSGQTENAIAETDKLIRAKVTGDVLFGAACIYAQCVEAMKSDAKQTDELVGKAVTQLRRLQKGGFFQVPDNVALLQTEEQLNPIRRHPQFEKFVAEIGKRAPPSLPPPVRGP